MTSKLLPCPFCGVTPEPFSYPKGSAIEATCNDEECPAFNIVVSIKSWNTRAAPEAPRQEPVDAILLEDCEEGVMQDYGRVYFATDDCVRQLYRHPAPLSPDHSGGGAGMVLPEQYQYDEVDRYNRDNDYVDGWNACLDKVKELNQ